MKNFTQPSATAPRLEPSPAQNSAKGSPQTIKSYVRRQGKITAGQKKALLTLSERWIWPYAGAPLAMEAIFQRPGPVILEIGFGMGETTAQIALAYPETNFLAVEVYDAGVGSLMQRAEKSGLKNLKIIQHDAVAVVGDGIAANLLAGVHIFFPDPWPKKRHHKRRLLQAEFVDLVVGRLEPGGYLHVATDWPDYAAQILGLLSAHPELQNTNLAGGFSPRPDTRPLTKFEQRGLRLGNPVVDMIFTRQIKN